MTRDDIIRMAEEAGMMRDENVWFSKNRFHIDVDMADLERFANLVAAAEREACAKVCESAGLLPDAGPIYCAFAIRERGAP
jgi:hypothetical protein